MINYSNKINASHSRLLFDPATPPFIINKGIGWHYTSTENAIKILESQSLFSTSFTELNDYKEFSHGLEIIKSEFKNILEKSHFRNEVKKFILDWNGWDSEFNKNENLFFISASLKNDTVAQWSLYADNGYGVSIGLDTSKMMRPFQEIYQFGPSYHGFAFSWLRILYKDAIKRKSVFLLVQHFETNFHNPNSITNQETFNFLFFLLACSFKDESFSFEKEIRAVYYSNNIKNSVTLKDKRSKRVEPWHGAEHLSDYTIGKTNLPIIRLKLGPKFEFNNCHSEELIAHCQEQKIKILNFK